MDKPEYPEEIMAMARKALDDAEAECIKERYVYGFGTGNAKTVLDMHIARAILSAQERAYIDAASIAGHYRANMSFWLGKDWQIASTAAEQSAQDISAAILSRKDEVGR